MLWKMMTFVLTHFPSTLIQTCAKQQSQALGIPSMAAYMMEGSLVLGIRAPFFLKACTSFSEETRVPRVLPGVGQDEWMGWDGRWEETQLWWEPGAPWGCR